MRDLNVLARSSATLFCTDGVALPIFRVAFQYDSFGSFLNNITGHNRALVNALLVSAASWLRNKLSEEPNLANALLQDAWLVGLETIQAMSKQMA